MRIKRENMLLCLYLFFLLFVSGQMWRKRTWCGGQVRKAVVGQLGLEFCSMPTFCTRTRLGLRSLATHQEVLVEIIFCISEDSKLIDCSKKI